MIAEGIVLNHPLTRLPVQNTNKMCRLVWEYTGSITVFSCFSSLGLFRSDDVRGASSSRRWRRRFGRWCAAAQCQERLSRCRRHTRSGRPPLTARSRESARCPIRSAAAALRGSCTGSARRSGVRSDGPRHEGDVSAVAVLKTAYPEWPKRKR